MTNLSVKRRFSNHRQWREFIAAVHESITSPSPVSSARAGEVLRWQTSANWLSVRRDAAVVKRQPAAMRVDIAVSLA